MSQHPCLRETGNRASSPNPSGATIVALPQVSIWRAKYDLFASGRVGSLRSVAMRASPVTEQIQQARFPVFAVPFSYLEISCTQFTTKDRASFDGKFKLVEVAAPDANTVIFHDALHSSCSYGISQKSLPPGAEPPPAYFWIRLFGTFSSPCKRRQAIMAVGVGGMEPAAPGFSLCNSE